MRGICGKEGDDDDDDEDNVCRGVFVLVSKRGGLLL